MQRLLLGLLCWGLGIGFTLTSGAHLLADDELVPVGAAKIDVTPSYPVLLAGYGSRTVPSEDIDSRIYARALAIGEKVPVVLIAVENCGVPAELVERVAERLQAEEQVPRERLVVCSTHTHNAPTLRGYAPVLWGGRAHEADWNRTEHYTDWLGEQMVEVARRAIQAREPARLSWGQGSVTFGGNRRVLTEQGWAGFGFQLNGPVDHSLPVMVARATSGKPLAIWVNYACHCTTLGDRNTIHGDWAGVASGLIEENHPGAVALTTIGCGADVGPQPTGTLELASAHGRKIAEEVKRLLDTSLQPLRAEIATQMRMVELPFQGARSREELEKMQGAFYEYYARQQLAILEEHGQLPTHLKYPISTWTFGKDLAVVFLAGEVVVDYSIRLKRELDWRRLWINGWSHDVPCYIPSARVLREGGYESDFSMIYYNQPSSFAPEVEEVIASNVREMLGPTFLAGSDQPEFPYGKHPVLSGEVPDPMPSAEERNVMKQTLAKSLGKLEPDQLGTIVERLQAASEQEGSGFGELSEQPLRVDTWFDFTGQRRLRPFIRQSQEGEALRWRSAPVAGNASAQPITLAFLGGLGWITEPAAEGFELMLDERFRVAFDVTLDARLWKSEDGQLELIYLPTWVSPADSGGLFLVTMPRDLLREREAHFTVRSRGGGSQRWFAVDTLREVKPWITFVREAVPGGK